MACHVNRSYKTILYLSEAFSRLQNTSLTSDILLNCLLTAHSIYKWEILKELLNKFLIIGHFMGLKHKQVISHVLHSILLLSDHLLNRFSLETQNARHENKGRPSRRYQQVVILAYIGRVVTFLVNFNLQVAG